VPHWAARDAKAKGPPPLTLTEAICFALTMTIEWLTA